MENVDSSAELETTTTTTTTSTEDAHDWLAVAGGAKMRGDVNIKQRELLDELERTIKNNFTEAHRERLRKFAPWAVIPKEERVTTFEKMAEQMEWGPRTQSTYFACLLSVLKILGMETTHQDLLKQRRVSAAAAAAPHWDIEDCAQVLSNERIVAMEDIARHTPCNSPMNAALLTLYMGQRMGDIIQIKLQNIVTIADNIAVTFKEFKTAGKKGPYTLMVKACSRAGAILLNIGRQAKTDGRSTGRIFFRALGGNIQETVGQCRRQSASKDRADQASAHAGVAGRAVTSLAPLIGGDVEPLSAQRVVQHENSVDHGKRIERGRGDAAAMLWQALRGLHTHGMSARGSSVGRNASWPLHVKSVGRIERKRAEQYIHSKYWLMWCEAWDIMGGTLRVRLGALSRSGVRAPVELRFGACDRHELPTLACERLRKTGTKFWRSVDGIEWCRFTRSETELLDVNHGGPQGFFVVL